VHAALPSPVSGRVLVVDDEPALRRAMGRSLAGRGHEVVQAASGQEAIDELDRGRFDVVVSDIQMTGLDGMHLLREVHARESELPVVLVTGAPDIRTAMEATEFGALLYLTKPFDLGKLAQVVERAIVRYRGAVARREALARVGEAAARDDGRAALGGGFERALATLWMAYQPIVRPADRTTLGFEALVRTREPSLPHPGALLGAAETLGRLPDLGRAIRRAAAGAMGLAPSGALLFVNLHARDLLDDELFAQAEALSGIARKVVLEITERASLEEVPDFKKRVEALREMGFRLAVDDLGAGYAGLNSLTTLEPEVVKLDMALVRGVAASARQQKLIRTMTTLCQDLGITAVVEGVETVEERDVLLDLGCEYFQGYLFARPGEAFPPVRW
jgi:EAL domain-containing protein (putative c-di-GMP-specific phosphodiesterase class I)